MITNFLIPPVYFIIAFILFIYIFNNCWIIEEAKDSQKKKKERKKIYSYFVDYTETFDSVDHNKLWKNLKDMGIPGHFTCLLRNLFVGQEEAVRTGQGTTNWFQIGKGVFQGCILSPRFFNIYAEYIMQNAGLDESLVGVKIVRRNDNIRYADATTVTAGTKEPLEKSERGE